MLMITIFITSYINFLRYKPKPILPPGIHIKTFNTTHKIIL